MICNIKSNESDKFLLTVCVGGHLEGILSRMCLCVASII